MQKTFHTCQRVRVKDDTYKPPVSSQRCPEKHRQHVRIELHESCPRDGKGGGGGDCGSGPGVKEGGGAFYGHRTFVSDTQVDDVRKASAQWCMTLNDAWVGRWRRQKAASPNKKWYGPDKRQCGLIN